jgi:Subtilase family/Secretion system C-terminal sorting domain
MKLHPIPLIMALLFACTSFSQSNSKFTISLQSGAFTPEKNISASRLNDLSRKLVRSHGKSLVIIQFDTLPGENERKLLKAAGIDLLDYISGNAYTATSTTALNAPVLSKLSVRSIVEPSPVQKMQVSLANGTFRGNTGTMNLWISFPKTFTFEEVSEGLHQKNFDIISTEFHDYRVIALRVPAFRLTELAALPFIDYVQQAPKRDEILNDKSEAITRANVLHSSLPGGRALRGEGIVIGVGDDSNPLVHVDFTGRLINRAAIATAGHGVHVIGTVGGAGIQDERYAGYAPKAKIIAQSFSRILAFAPEYVKDYRMVVTNNSYGNVVDDCKTFGIYDLYSRIMDQQTFQMPNLQHVFAVGNSGTMNCSPYLAGFSNVLGGYQTAKNVICVGNASEIGIVAPGSSKGPVRDGRIKPEIMAQGTRVYSTWPGNLYIAMNGTSMSSPAVAGGLGLLYQRYRELNANADPKNGLMKALLINGATDIGNPGPDYTYGFGWMNLLRSVKMLESNDYINVPVNAGGINTHTITIPAGSAIAQLKVMLYWNDSAAAVLASRALVNDLDLEVKDPSALVYFPQLLDTVPANITKPAITGVDHINNIEQVVIDNPVSGTYTFSVKGTSIPLGNQHEYFLVYDTIPVSSILTYPVGDEHFKGGDSMYVSWDSYGNTTNDFSLQFSPDNGVTWSPIATGIAANLRQFKWFLPTVATNQARVKLIHNGTGIESISAPFTILGVPAISLAPVQCEGYIALSWPAIPAATDYEIMLLRGDEMVPVGTTASTQYTIGGLSKDTLYFVSVRARINGRPGRRAPALTRQPNNGTCTGNISDDDLKIDAILSPVSSGRKFTSTELSSLTTITIRIKNLDDAPTTGNIPVSYTIGGNPPVNETIIAPAIAAGATYTYNFATKADMSAVGMYDIKVAISYPGDPLAGNDTIRASYRQLDNTPVDLSSDFVDNFEAAPVQSFNLSQKGLTSLDRYDFISSTVNGRIRTFISSGIASSGSKALTMDADRYTVAGNTDSLTATFNLAAYDPLVDDIRLDFLFKQHGQSANAANKVWVRGKDDQPWIQAYDLYANQAVPGIYKRSLSLELSDLLSNNSQPLSSSFQVKWGQWGQMLTADNESAAGYTFDDIHLYKVSNDIQVVSVDSPIVAGCGLGNAVPVKITIRNTANAAIANIPVKMKVDNGSVIAETIASIPGNATMQYTFTTTADLATLGAHVVKTWADLPADTYHANDTAMVALFNSPVISSYPYLQDFELGDGSWYPNGKNSSWQYGTPASTKINGAASGSKAWKTGLTGNYNDDEQSFLYSPCFDLTGMASPTLSLSIALDLEDCGATLCDAAFAEYSVDGKIWTRLGAMGAGTNWYNKTYAGNGAWSVQDYTRWHVATIPLPMGINRLRLRFGIASDPYVSKEGIAIDDIHIYDKQFPIYDGPPSTSAVVTMPSVSGSNWLDFTAGGKIVASINPKGQQLGNTDAQVYINTGAVRNYNNQYYHNRNITIKPGVQNPADSSSVRFYFLDSETEALIAATGCAGCSKPSSAYELGVTRYSDANHSLENGDLLDDAGSNWLFVNAARTRKVPYDKGYYAEINVKKFSEFWLSKNRLDNTPAPSSLFNAFTAHKIAVSDVRLDWTTANEFNVEAFEVEVARSNEEFQSNTFTRIGEVASPGNSITARDYTFTDAETGKTGVRYYRLKIVGTDGSFSYSAVRPVVFTEVVKWQLYPNPARDVVNMVYQLEEGKTIMVTVHDLTGRSIKQMQFTATGFIQKTTIDISRYAAGLYLFEVSTEERKEGFRVLKL